VKARLDSNVQCIDIRIGSDDEGGLTKAIDNVFPNATRLLCSKHIKDNVTDHIKNKLPITKDQRSDIMSNLFGIINADDTTGFDVRSENLCSSFPVFSAYFNSKLKTRMLEHVIRPSRQGTNTRLWTNNNCERMNHRFKISTDWKPQRLPDLVNTIHDIVRLHVADLKRALFTQGNYELECAFQHLYLSH
jgi:transposase-like protein